VRPSQRPSLDLVAAVRDESVSPEVAALLIARDAKPELRIEHEIARIDGLAAELGQQDLGAPPTEQAHALSAFLYDRLGFRGNEDDYHDPRNSYLDDVMTRRTGIPITLAVLLQAVGRRAGFQVEGIGFPSHFLARVGGPDGVYVDPFFGGRVLTNDALERLAVRLLGPSAKLMPEHLQPVSLRALVVRMLLNLKHAHERLGDHSRSLLVCDRLVDLTDSLQFRRDRGMHAMEMGAFEAARADLDAYLAASPNAEDAEQIRTALSRARTSRPPTS
jgi:regulator of sirC expression with transglutaminase-like and TPR domain